MEALREMHGLARANAVLVGLGLLTAAAARSQVVLDLREELDPDRPESGAISVRPTATGCAEAAS